MEALGTILRREREKRGLTIDHVSRETNISKHYLEALEKEEYGVFPGEPYLLGFLRNYADYLELPVEELLTLYRHHKIQEQPSPMEVLVPLRRPFPWKPVIVLVSGIAVGVLVYFFQGTLVNFFSSLPSYLWPAPPKGASPQIHAFPADSQELEGRFFPSDVIEVTYLDKTYPLRIALSQDVLVLEAPMGNHRLRLGNEVFLDLDDDGTTDLRVALMDMDTRNPQEGGVALLLNRINSVSPLANASVAVGSETPLPLTEPINVRPERQRPVQTLLEAPSPGTLQVEAVFRGRTLFRYQADERPREEGVWDKGEVFKIEAARQILIGVANAGAVALRINGKDVDLGESGQVVVRMLRWVRSSGGFQLRLEPLY